MARVTRVEKFKEYRKEIAFKYSDANASNKKKASDQVNLALKNQNNPQLGYSQEGNTITLDDILKTYNIYDENKGEMKSPLLEKYKKERAIKITGWVLCGVLSVALLIVGILYFGGIVQ